MYNIKFDSYIPKPEPAKSDRVVAAHYYAAWKKGSAGIHEGFNDLAEEFPDRTPLMGYYDEENPEVCDWEIKWALEHGINCFIYCWYRYDWNMGKPVTNDALRCGHGIHEALFNAKYGDMMNFAIMYEASPRWCGTDEVDMLENLMPYWMENYFKRDNYLKIDNKPVLFVYQQQRLRDCFKSAESQMTTFDACREYSKKCGFDGMIFATCDIHPTKAANDEALSRGYDFRFPYRSKPDDNAAGDEAALLESHCDNFRKLTDIDPMTHIPIASCFWDPTPRFSDRWNSLGFRFKDYGSIWYLQPEGYRMLLERIKAMADALPDGAWGKRIMMIDNWNEWDEGHFVAPSHKFGFKYLQAIREVMTERNNLPDYRTPADQGFGDYNKSWVTPDFKEFCENDLKK